MRAKLFLISSAMLIQAIPVWNPVVEAFKIACLTIITITVGWIARTVFLNRDESRTMKQVLISGSDGTGKDSLVEQFRRMKEDVDEIKGWKRAIEAVEEAERDLYQGEERRHHARRLKDVITERHIHTDEHKRDK